MPPGRASTPRGALQAAVRVGERAAVFIRGRSRESYLADEILRAAIERLLIRFGEALNHVPAEVLHAIDPAMDWSGPIGFRHLAAHWYLEGIDHNLIWLTVSERLPAAVTVIAAYLERAKDE